ncbi:MAG: tRNA glutamyl-Q(34) synthetase GluQRS [Desulfovibrionaceae bacterium]|nr:tRNA glutamyl-Q(34) synthetase GluQRS [Desulfovibrionaceae bacterium]
MAVRGRLAPSPTGMAHLGNAWAFLTAWLAVRSQGGELVLRMEDLDLERSSVVFMQLLMSDIRWLGLDWDEGPTPERELAQYHQSNRFGLYEEMLERLRGSGLAYPCFCSRKDLLLASAPHLGDAGHAYPGTCRHLSPEEVRARLEAGGRAAWRFRSDGRAYEFNDLVLGPQRATLEECGGDFSMRRPDGVFSYQLAVSVDDGLMGITQVVRGRDILPSTPRQLAILDALGMARPAYAHIPLLMGEDGERLAKRHASLSLDALRTRGVRPWRVIGLLASIAGLIDRREEVHPRDLVPLFDITKLRCHDYPVSQADLDWLES